MEQPASLGATVRDRRLALGYSLGQLATRVHRTAASIRSWERGATLPDETEVAALAAALDLDAAALAGLLPEVNGGEPAADGEAALADPWTGGAGATRGRSEVIDDVIDEAPPMRPASSGPAPIHEAMTEAVPVVTVEPALSADEPSPAAAGSAATGRRAFTFADGANPLVQVWDFILDWYRTIFDPDRKWIYRIRIVLLLISFYIMLRVLGWAVGHLWDAIQEVLDSFSFSPTDTPDVAN